MSTRRVEKMAGFIALCIGGCAQGLPPTASSTSDLATCKAELEGIKEKGAALYTVCKELQVLQEEHIASTEGALAKCIEALEADEASDKATDVYVAVLEKGGEDVQAGEKSPTLLGVRVGKPAEQPLVPVPVAEQPIGPVPVAERPVQGPLVYCFWSTAEGDETCAYSKNECSYLRARASDPRTSCLSVGIYEH